MLKTTKTMMLAIAITIMLPTTASAQQLQAIQSHYSTTEGLCSNAVSDIKQDDYGYIWIATWNGLSRYDGYTFYNYPTGPSSHTPLLHNRILQLTIDVGQNVWMRMYDGRIFVLDRRTDNIVNPLEGQAGYENFKTKSAMLNTTDGKILAYIEGIGVYSMKKTFGGVSKSLINCGNIKVKALAEGYHGDIWAGTSQGIRRLNLTDETIGSIADFADEDITCMYSNGYSIYAGTASGKIVRTGYGQTPTVVREIGEAVTSLYIDGHGIIWYSTRAMGINRIAKDGTEKSFSQIVKVPEYDVEGATFAEIGGTLWISLNHGGFGYYNRAADEIEYFHNDPAYLWNLSNTVAAFLTLPEGVVFESTSRRGLEKLELLSKTINRTRIFDNADNTNANEIRAMYYDEKTKTLFIGNKQSRLVVMRGDSRTELTGDNAGNPFGRIYDISKDSRGNYWISTKGNGLFRMTPVGNGFSIRNFRHNPNNKYTLSNNNVYATTEDRNGNIWVATFGGGVNILTYNSKGNEIFINSTNSMRNYPPLSYLRVRSVELDSKGKVWVGTSDGILLMSYRNGYVVIEELNKEMSDDEPIGSFDIITIARHPDGTMWIGTNGGGLSRYVGMDKKRKARFENFSSQKDGLPSDEIKSITFDKRGNVWFAADNVICSFDNEKHIFTPYSMLDGVDETACSEGASLTLPNGNILVGTIDGYYTIDQTKLVDKENPMLKLRFTDFYVNEQLMSPRLNDTYDFYLPDSRSVRLPSHSSSFSAVFASLNYRLQHRVHYQYMLAGYDKRWHNASRTRTASYSDLPAGTYKLNVKAFLLEQPEKFEMKTIEIVVPPMFLFSSSAIWFYMALFAIVTLTLLYSWENRQMRLMAKKSETEE